MDAKSLLIRLHRWSGLTLALFLAALGISGALMTLEGRALPSSFVGERHHQIEPGGERAPIADVVGALEQAYGALPQQLSIRGEPGRPDEYRFPARLTVFVDPASGEILGDATDFRTAFSRTLWTFHATLLLGEPGRWIVGVSTAVLVLSLLAGLVLTLDPLRRQGRHAVSLRWTGNGRSWNLRFHNLMGLVWAPVLLLIALSGCFIAFEPVERATLRLLGGTPGLGAETYPISTGLPGASPITPDTALHAARVLEDPEPFYSVWLHFPRTAEEAWRIQITGSGNVGRREVVFVDRYSGRRLADPYAEQRTHTDTTRWLVRSFHYGSFGGAPTEALWFLGCLMLPVFAVSGFLIWRVKAGARSLTRRWLPAKVLTRNTAA